MVILVTGSSGFVGEVLVAKLISLGYDVIGIDHTTGKHTTKIIDITKPFTLDLAQALTEHNFNFNQINNSIVIGI